MLLLVQANPNGKESLLLETLMVSSTKVVSRDRLPDKLWDSRQLVDDNTLNVNITRIRKKISEFGVEEALETVRGAGYKLGPFWRKEP
ncbi:Response regulator protein GraR [compost metagenome]